MKDTLDRWLRNEITGWSMGSFGAICEFIRWPGDAPETQADEGLDWLTHRGGIRFDQTEALTALAWDMPSTNSKRFFRHVEFLLPAAEALVPQPVGLSEIGVDHDAIAPRTAT